MSSWICFDQLQPSGLLHELLHVQIGDALIDNAAGFCSARSRIWRRNANRSLGYNSSSHLRIRDLRSRGVLAARSSPLQPAQ
jgi:hypothetical protein